MSHTSPASYLVWGILTCILFVFLVFHMWSFDHFRSLKWSNGPHPRAFKRIMTYSYMLSVPLIMTYSLGFATIKYRQGFIESEGVVIPKPYVRWPEAERRAIFPLTLTFAIAWSLEMTTHLEELCFWFFLVKSASGPQDWFRSGYFRTWIVGACVAIIYMPLLTILTRSDPLKSEAYTFLGGSLGSLLLTLSFTPILWAFPSFLANLKREGVDTGTIVRLTKFHELNMIRIVFRYIFVVPLVLLGADGVRPHKHINESMVWTDFLTMIAAFGCCISSALTLVIFFPRSVETEIAAKDAARERRRSRRLYGGRQASMVNASQEGDARSSLYSPSAVPSGHYLVSPPPSNKHRYSFPSQDGHAPGPTSIASPELVYKEWAYEGDRERQLFVQPNRRHAEDIEMRGDPGGLTNGYRRNASNLNPLVHNFKSPIDPYGGERPPNPLTFTQQ
ncbi:hypothetical protein B0H19DRAFT_1103992 [Mycena capillaripes]|nr:hypothetical protein B0H19DRAFT_1103992 [Mycena capillaripes]